MSGDPSDPKPALRGIAAYIMPDGKVYLSKLPTVSLDEAEQLHRLGWAVLIDPEDEQALARWEQMQRAQQRRKWTNW